MSAPSLPDALGLRPGDLVALVGGGGKSALLFALGAAWSGGCVLSATTKLSAGQLQRVPAWFILGEAVDPALARAVAGHGHCLIVERIRGDKALGVARTRPGRWLERDDVTLVVVEADGSRRRPVKAPGPHEPVIPPDATLVVVVAGIDALAGPIRDVAHRPERVCALTGLTPHDTLTPIPLARLLIHPEGGLKDVPHGARVAVCLNKVETEAQSDQARAVAARISEHPRVGRVVMTALESNRPVRLISSPHRGED